MRTSCSPTAGLSRSQRSLAARRGVARTTRPPARLNQCHDAKMRWVMVAALCTTLAPGCALSQQRRAPYPARLDTAPDCDTGRELLIADAALAAATAALA